MFDQIKSLMQKHDWFFDYSDDMRDWRKGSAEKQEILALMRKIPMNQIPELMKLVPEELKAKWLIELQMVAIPPGHNHKEYIRPPTKEESIAMQEAMKELGPDGLFKTEIKGEFADNNSHPPQEDEAW